MKRFLLLICLWLTGYTVLAQCNAAFTTTSSGQQVNFSPAAANAGLRHTWLFGDGTSSSLVSPVHVYSQPGTFQVVHAVYDSTNQCRDSAMVAIQVAGGIPCTAGISYVRDSGFFNRYQFSSAPSTTTSGTITGWRWRVDGQLVSTNSSMTITLTPGAHTICLEVISSSGCANSTCINVTAPASTASCNAAFTTTATGQQVRFNPASATAGLRHNWTFGDGASSSAVSPIHTYNQGGLYRVVHAVYDSLSLCRDSSVVMLQVAGGIPCIATILYARDSTTFNQYVFSGSQSTTLSGSITGYRWRVDGQLVSTSSTFTRTLSAGSHTVCLEVISSSGCSASTCVNLAVPQQPSGCNWQANFTWQYNPLNPEEVRFTPSPIDSSYVYEWQFGDGTSSNQRFPSHHYRPVQNVQSYTVRLVVRNPGTNCLDTVTRVVSVVRRLCYANIQYYGVDSSPNRIRFLATSNDVRDTIASVSWKIRRMYDSVVIATLQGTDPVYTFADTGTYSVCVRAVMTSGCVSENCAAVRITRIQERRLAGGQIPSYPNPASSEVGVSVQLLQASALTISVFNDQGNRVYYSQRSGAVGTNNLAIPVQSLTRGTYYIEVRFGSEVRRSRFLKF